MKNIIALDCEELTQAVLAYLRTDHDIADINVEKYVYLINDNDEVTGVEVVLKNIE